MSSWSNYLAKGIFYDQNASCTIIYHMCPKSAWENAMQSKQQVRITNAKYRQASCYYPPTFDQDGGFIHATSDPSLLLFVANHFYQSSSDEWICLELDPKYLTGLVKFEPAAPVGNTAAAHKTDEPLFPHIYGGISHASVTRTYPIVRDEKGQFLSIQNLC